MSEQRKTRTILIKFLLSRSIRSFYNTTHSNERYVPITGYRRQLLKDKYSITVYSVGHHSLKDFPFHITMDNWFTPLQLFLKLKEIGYEATGTIRKNKVERKLQLTSGLHQKDKEKQQTRGYLCSCWEKYRLK